MQEDTQVAESTSGTTTPTTETPASATPSPELTEPVEHKPYGPEELGPMMKNDPRLLVTVKNFISKHAASDRERTAMFNVLLAVVVEAGGFVKFSSTTFSLLHKDDTIAMEVGGQDNMDRYLKYVPAKRETTGIILTDGK
jgi:hypothetical protein